MPPATAMYARAPARRKSNDSTCPALTASDVQRGLLLAVELERQIGAGDGDHGVLLELERRPAEGRLEHRRALVVADEQVGGAEGVVVERARGRHAEVVQPEAPRVLHGRAHPAVVDADHAYNLRTSSALYASGSAKNACGSNSTSTIL